MTRLVLIAVLLASPVLAQDAGVKAPKAKKTKPHESPLPTLPVTRASCPASRDEVKQNTRCELTEPEVCQFGAKSWCECAGTSCVTAAGPIPGCVSTLVWACRDDGCPRSPVGACPREGQLCGYDDGLCSSQIKCSKGQWTSLGSQCRPSAPPGPQ